MCDGIEIGLSLDGVNATLQDRQKKIMLACIELGKVSGYGKAEKQGYQSNHAGSR
jgi:hypothetical protein